MDGINCTNHHTTPLKSQTKQHPNHYNTHNHQVGLANKQAETTAIFTEQPELEEHNQFTLKTYTICSNGLVATKTNQGYFLKHSCGHENKPRSSKSLWTRKAQQNWFNHVTIQVSFQHFPEKKASIISGFPGSSTHWNASLFCLNTCQLHQQRCMHDISHGMVVTTIRKFRIHKFLNINVP